MLQGIPQLVCVCEREQERDRDGKTFPKGREFLYRVASPSFLPLVIIRLF